MRKSVASLLTFVLLTSIAPSASAKPRGDWNAVKALTGQPITLKARGGKTSFGILRSADDDGVKVQVAGKEELADNETLFRRDEVEKVWRANLRFGERNTAKGAWVGAGVGLGAGFLTAWALSKKDDTACVGCGLFPIYGAGLGAVVGTFVKKEHKKGKLIYSI